MLDDRGQLKQEVIQAAIIHYQLQEEDRVYPVVRELPLEQAERADFTHRFAVMVAGHAAIVRRDWNGAYKVEDDPERQLTEDEAEVQEAYQILMAAVHYLEMNLDKVGSIEVQDISNQLPAGEHAWAIRLNSEQCVVKRHESDQGFSYTAYSL